ncbi:MAG: hypothetical protein OHK005_10930 [Candidatus Methylacidiphilales bacterium]
MILGTLLAGAIFAAAQAEETTAIRLTPEQALAVGQRIWKNECGGTVDGLTSWNRGEDFASLGIGHFIWYPEGKRGPFEESFPELITFLRQRGVKIPQWLLETKACPWPTREAFERDRQSPRMVKLRQFLAATVGDQALFAARRLERALPKMTAGLTPSQRAHVETQFRRVASVPHGVYCLMDYVNFKGEGVSPTERYQGEGWGLLQVLQGMRGTAPGPAALKEFSQSAAAVLTRRVKNSPPERNEARWLPGWRNRCLTYQQP